MHEITIEPPQREIRRSPHNAKWLRVASWIAVVVGAAVAVFGLAAALWSLGAIRSAYHVSLVYAALAVILVALNASRYLRGHGARRDAARAWIGEALRELADQTPSSTGAHDESCVVVRPKRPSSLIAVEVRRRGHLDPVVRVKATPAVLPDAALGASLSAPDGVPLSEYLSHLDADVDRARRTNAAQATTLLAVLLLVMQVMARLAERAA